LWLIPLLGSLDLESAVRYLRSQRNFSEKLISVVVSKYETIPEMNCGGFVEPAFWTFTEKEELGPLFGSLSRCAYAVLRKYGEEGAAEISKAFSNA
jgi:hypothetical protein